MMIEEAKVGDTIEFVSVVRNRPRLLAGVVAEHGAWGSTTVADVRPVSDDNPTNRRYTLLAGHPVEVVA